ncbi:MAG: hypothetical protein DYH12_01665 [Sorangiineae bacterium PRO1]|nr:hypothetical protein [Sorangiineae bacterium PRO1]
MKLHAWLPVIAAVLVASPALFIVVNLHWFFLQNASYVGFDDGYTVALAERIIDGNWLPYVDGCSHRGPVLYWLVAVAQKLTGRFNWIGPRSLMFAASLVTLFAMLGTGFVARLPLAGAVGALLWVYLGLIAHDTDSAFGVTGESIAAALGMLALFFLAWGLVRATRFRNRVLLVALSGVATAMAGFTKQTAFPTAVPLFAWVFCAALSLEGITRRQRLGLLGAFVGGILGVVVIVLSRYVISGHMRTFWYWFYTYNREVYMAPMREVPFRSDFDNWARGQHWAFFAIALAASWGLARPLAEVRSFRDLLGGYARAGLEVTTSALVLVVFAAVASPQRFWPTYFIMVFPFMAMAAGVQLALTMDRAQGHPWARFAGAILLGGALSSWIGYAARLRVKEVANDFKSERRKPALPEPICDLLDKYGSKDDPLFVWGFDADFYITCKRHPATRFTYLTLVAGTVPPAWNDVRPELQARNARRDLMHDLEVSRPAVVLNSPGSMRNVGIHTVPELTDWLKRDYCPIAPVKSRNGRQSDVWVRRDLTPCTDGG